MGLSRFEYFSGSIVADARFCELITSTLCKPPVFGFQSQKLRNTRDRFAAFFNPSMAWLALERL
jgi:hypothetical protein